MNYPVRMRFTVRASQEGNCYVGVMDGHLTAEPRKGRKLNLNVPAGDINFTIQDVWEDLDHRRLVVTLKDIKDPSTVKYQADANNACDVLIDAFKKLGWVYTGEPY